MTTATVIKDVAYFSNGSKFGTLHPGDVLEGGQYDGLFKFTVLKVSGSENVRIGNFTCSASPMYLRIAATPEPEPEPLPDGTDFTLVVEGFQPFSGTLLPK